MPREVEILASLAHFRVVNFGGEHALNAHLRLDDPIAAGSRQRGTAIGEKTMNAPAPVTTVQAADCSPVLRERGQREVFCGLTGIMTRIAFRMSRVPSGHVRVTRQRLDNLHSFLEAFEAARDASYSVGWIDARFDSNGVDLTMRAFAGHTAENGKVFSVKWA